MPAAVRNELGGLLLCLECCLSSPLQEMAEDNKLMEERVDVLIRVRGFACSVALRHAHLLASASQSRLLMLHLLTGAALSGPGNVRHSCSLALPSADACPDAPQELRIWQTRLDISAVLTRGAIAATQDMLAAETARARTDIATICDKSDRAVIKGGAAPADQFGRYAVSWRGVHARGLCRVASVL
jgi:hypothetical protein